MPTAAAASRTRTYRLSRRLEREILTAFIAELGEPGARLHDHDRVATWSSGRDGPSTIKIFLEHGLVVLNVNGWIGGPRPAGPKLDLAVTRDEAIHAAAWLGRFVRDGHLRSRPNGLTIDKLQSSAAADLRRDRFAREVDLSKAPS